MNIENLYEAILNIFIQCYVYVCMYVCMYVGECWHECIYVCGHGLCIHMFHCTKPFRTKLNV